MHRPHSGMFNCWTFSSRRYLTKLPLLLYHGLPAIILGILFNTLDAGQSTQHRNRKSHS